MKKCKMNLQLLIQMFVYSFASLHPLTENTKKRAAPPTLHCIPNTTDYSHAPQIKAGYVLIELYNMAMVGVAFASYATSTPTCLTANMFSKRR